MSAESAIEQGKERSEATMIDTCKVWRVVRERQPDYTNKDVRTLVYGGPDCPWNGKCKVQTYEPDAIERDSAGRPAVTQEYRLHLPNRSGPFQIGDVAEVDGYPDSFLIDGLLLKTFQTSQRLKATVQPNKTG